jgi:hypothetical protein
MDGVGWGGRSPGPGVRGLEAKERLKEGSYQRRGFQRAAVVRVGVRRGRGDGWADGYRAFPCFRSGYYPGTRYIQPTHMLYNVKCASVVE